ncbi:MAG TPA: hypothetical protein VEJ63_11815 [Planctomycetota bacterium]|nr:hypothetical protein [Planctomycetota bacterium]
MTAKPREFWQIHLSTALLMMIVSGAFLWLNTLPNIGLSPGIWLEPPRPGYAYLFYGFPFWFLLLETGASTHSRWFIEGIVLNVLVVLALLLGTAAASEYRIRHKSKR